MQNDTEKFNRGNQAEEAQLQKHGLEKNYYSVREIDPKTGLEGTTIPDALKNEGKSTSEIKYVKEQSLTKQLRLQERFSNSHGLKPELIINQGAHLTGPLKHSSFEIKTYNFGENNKEINSVSQNQEKEKSAGFQNNPINTTNIAPKEPSNSMSSGQMNTMSSDSKIEKYLGQWKDQPLDKTKEITAFSDNEKSSVKTNELKLGDSPIPSGGPSL